MNTDIREQIRAREYEIQAANSMQMGQHRAGAVFDCVNEMERTICGPHAVLSPARAEGLSLAGLRSANLLPPAQARTEARATGPVSGSPWVFHRFAGLRLPTNPGASFELAATGAQEAVDHCLVAHRLTEKSGFTAVCTLDPPIAGALDVVQIPSREAVAGFLGDGRRAPRSEAGKSRMDHDELLPLARQVMDDVAAWTGRPCPPLHTYRTEDARYVLTVWGAAAVVARRAADFLRAHGIPVGVVIPGLIRPFPRHELARLLDNREAVVVVESEPRNHIEFSLLSEVRAALALRHQHAQICSIPEDDSPENVVGLLQRILDVLPDEDVPGEIDMSAAQVCMPSIRVGAVPDCAWSNDMLLAFAARLHGIAHVQVASPRTSPPGIPSLLIGPRDHDAPLCHRSKIDVLAATHAALLHPARVVPYVRRGGVVVLLSDKRTERSGWATLSERTRRMLRARNIEVWQVARFTAGEPSPTENQALGELMQGGLARASSRLLHEFDIHTALLQESATSTTDHFSIGFGRTRRMRKEEKAAGEIAALDPAPGVSGLPQLPENAGAGWDGWASRIRDFHVTGHGESMMPEPAPGFALCPALLMHWARPSARSWPFPYYLPGSDDEAGKPATLHALLTEALGQDTSPEADLLRRNLWRVSYAAAHLIVQHRHAVALREPVRVATREVIGQFETREAGREALEAVMERLVAALPKTGHLVAAQSAALFELYAYKVRAARRPALRRFLGEVRTLAVRLEEILKTDALHGADGASQEHMEASLGDSAIDLVNVEALAAALPKHRGSERIEPAARKRIEQALRTLQAFCTNAEHEPDFLLVHAGPLPHGLVLDANCRINQPDSFAVAIGLFDGLAARHLPVFRAARQARLEIAGEYDPVVHAEALERLNLHMLSADELAVMPQVVLMEEEEVLQRAALRDFSHVLQSGRPIHTLVLHTLSHPERPGAPPDFDHCYPGLSYLSVAHREAYIVQGALAEPDELLAGMDGMLAANRPAVAFVGVPRPGEPGAMHWLRSQAAHHGRALPYMAYDPDQGDSWATRFDLSRNAQVERVWPQHDVPYIDEQGTEAGLVECMTFAHAVAMDPAFRQHFRVIPPEAWCADQIPVADYLDAMITTTPKAVPFIWTVDEEGLLQRAVITRELALMCRDRMRFWTLLQELAGINSAYVHDAEARTRDEAEKRFEAIRAQLEAEHRAALQDIRAEESGAAIDRLVQALMHDDLNALPAAPAPAAPLPAPAPVNRSEPTTPEPDDPDPDPGEAGEEILFHEPYITTARCTTCDDCFTISKTLFVYNENRQAVLTDPTAGTFEQLVRAAEKCPARCIHPGMPRAGDETVTEDLLRRAEPFNR